MQTSSEDLVIVVTGANGGVGFGICHRLIVQLSSARPSDAEPYFNAGRDLKRELDIPERAPDAGLTIIMACRDAKRAQVAREKLYRLLDEHIAKLTSPDAYSYAVAFRRNLRLDIERLDLSSVRSVLEFGRAVNQKYEHISHLIFNAGTATFSHLDIPGFLYDLFTHPIHAVEHPRRNIQVNGVLTGDGLGYTWQCNVFGHYVLYRSVQPLLLAHAQRTGLPARVLWMSSLDAEPSFDLDQDWQLTKTLHSYNASKFQIELICAELERRTLEAEAGRAPAMPEVIAPHGEVRHYIVSPGITSTNMSTLLNIPIPGWRYLMLTAFVIVRFLGSPHVLMSLYSAAVAAVHLALVPLFAIPDTRNSPHVTPADKAYPTWHTYHGKYTRASPGRTLTLRFGAENDRWGNDHPGVIAVPVWEEHPDAGEKLLERFERLYQAFVTAEKEGGKEEKVGNGHAR
ncbi:hypothetical protein PYCCODRAFT_1434279 [Trametes coccinea BRFM310]|uniref:3-keto sterol reductase n=1 Tax=Trametes coccinea (strain BRFM310) TaxID=1353009 RepID=A0A1Y2IUJ8_TRAC3|nr:hypothetical protein PYCCODRAFT_1434279 [Trametes coccinea BRFM310]